MSLVVKPQANVFGQWPSSFLLVLSQPQWTNHYMCYHNWWRDHAIARLAQSTFLPFFLFFLSIMVKEPGCSDKTINMHSFILGQGSICHCGWSRHHDVNGQVAELFACSMPVPFFYCKYRPLSKNHVIIVGQGPLYQWSTNPFTCLANDPLSFLTLFCNHLIFLHSVVSIPKD